MLRDRDEAVLSFPRDCIRSCRRFTPWEVAGPVMESAEEHMVWMPRHRAEASEDWIQPIPCAIVLGEQRKYHVFRRIDGGRSDLRSKISLLIGGHIDQGVGIDVLSSLIIDTLEREIAEELGINHLDIVKPIGLVVDFSSIEASRHIGVVHEVFSENPVRPIAIEEFSSQSKYIGQLYSPGELPMFKRDFDPWSVILFGDYINPSYSFDLGQQGRLL